MNKTEITVREHFPASRVAIIGDLVADQFLTGTISRVSREAPVFILRHDETETLPGAAANAAANVAALGGQAVLVGAVGADAHGDLLIDKLASGGVATESVVRDASITTTRKVRVLAGQHYAPRQQVIRIDYENAAPLAADIEQRLLDEIARVEADAFIISDYNCGTVSASVFDAVKQRAASRDIPLVIDSRYRLTEFNGATSATPNREEVERALGNEFGPADCELLRQRLDYAALLVTNGNEGMLLVEDGQPPLQIDAVGSKEPVDVTGAGDTVIAAYTLGLAAGLGFADSARVANHAGGIVVMKKRTAVATLAELCGSLAGAASSLTSGAH